MPEELGAHLFTAEKGTTTCLLCGKTRNAVAHDPTELYRQERDKAKGRKKPVILKKDDVPGEMEGEATDEQIAEARAIFDKLTAQAREQRSK